MPSYAIAPSILAADFACLGDEVDKVIEGGADMIHFDVMDNHYVPNLTIGPMVCQSLHRYGVKAPIDVHLMVKPVDAMISQFAKAGATYISFHPEATNHVDRSIELIKSFQCKAALAFNPATPLHILEYCLEKLDMILLMSVNPGFGGQSFIPSILKKIAQVRQMIDASGRDIRLQVDGGIQSGNIKAIAKAGADTFVAGSAIFGQADYAVAIDTMKQQLASIKN